MGASFLAQNAGKRSLTINLKSRAAKRSFAGLWQRRMLSWKIFAPGSWIGSALDTPNSTKSSRI